MGFNVARRFGKRVGNMFQRTRGASVAPTVRASVFGHTFAVGTGVDPDLQVLDTGPFTVGGNNRVLWVMAASGEFATFPPDALDFNGVAMTLVDSLAYTTFSTASLWVLINPPAVTGIVHAHWPGGQSERWLSVVAVQDANQFTPTNVLSSVVITSMTPFADAAGSADLLTLAFLSAFIGTFPFTATAPMVDLDSYLIDVFEAGADAQGIATGALTNCEWTAVGLPFPPDCAVFAFTVNNV